MIDDVDVIELDKRLEFDDVIAQVQGDGGGCLGPQDPCGAY